MLRYLFMALLVLHGLIHLLGAVKFLGLGSVPQLTGRTLWPLTEQGLRLSGWAWTTAFALLLLTATLFVLQVPQWWALALAASVLSQLLVVLHWPDAKAGTVANVLILLTAAAAVGFWQLGRLADAQRHHLNIVDSQNAVALQPLDTLPPVVQRWLVRSGATVADPGPFSIQQEGRMQLKPGGAWVPFAAAQTFWYRAPGFVWTTDLAMYGLPVMGVDRLVQGHGGMTIRVLGWLPVADARGPQIDEATLQRWLGELVWRPSMARLGYVQWQQTSDTSARATLLTGGAAVTGDFFFTPAGDFLRYETDRWGTFDGRQERHHWVITATAWDTVRGQRVPVQCAVQWLLPSGPWTWLEVGVR